MGESFGGRNKKDRGQMVGDKGCVGIGEIMITLHESRTQKQFIQ
jgi:hypothetical protein